MEAVEPPRVVGGGGALDSFGQKADEMGAIFALEADFVVMQYKTITYLYVLGAVGGHCALVIEIFAPPATELNALASPMIRPRGFTGLAARGASSVLDGVWPKKIQNAFPGGQ